MVSPPIPLAPWERELLDKLRDRVFPNARERAQIVEFEQRDAGVRDQARRESEAAAAEGWYAEHDYDAWRHQALLDLRSGRGHTVMTDEDELRRLEAQEIAWRLRWLPTLTPTERRQRLATLWDHTKDPGETAQWRALLVDDFEREQQTTANKVVRAISNRGRGSRAKGALRSYRYGLVAEHLHRNQFPSVDAFAKSIGVSRDSVVGAVTDNVKKCGKDTKEKILRALRVSEHEWANLPTTH